LKNVDKLLAGLAPEGRQSKFFFGYATPDKCEKKKHSKANN
jgi:hypothetical protein